MLGTPTPASPSHSHTRAFCEKLVAGGQPTAVVPSPPAGAAFNDCVNLVDAAVRADGGHRIDGWAIWETPGVLIEAEYHCVWRRSDGTLQDLAPLPPGLHSRLFLPDPQLKYDGRQINNVRQNLSGLPSVDRWIRALDARFEMLNRGERAQQHGAINVPPEETAPVLEELRRAQEAVAGAIRSQGRKAGPARSLKVGRNDPCPCGSGRKYKRCHGR